MTKHFPDSDTTGRDNEEFDDERETPEDWANRLQEEHEADDYDSMVDDNDSEERSKR